MIQGGGVELDELHVLNGSFCAVDHGDAVAGCHEGICGRGVDSTDTSGSHQGHPGQEFVDGSCLGVENVSTVASDVGCPTCHNLSKMVLRYDLDSEVVFKNVDIGILPNLTDEALLNFEAGVVGMVENTEFRVSAFAVEIELAIFLAVEIHTPLKQLADLLRSSFDHFFHGFRVAEPVASYHSIVDVFVEIVHFEVGHRGHTTLSERSVSFIESCLADQSHFCTGTGNLQREAHTGDARSYHEIIIFVSHSHFN